jgi:hypothetical protein
VKSTGPILAIGAITMANMTILHNQPFDMRVPLATAAAVGVFALGEKLYAPAAVGVAWLALVTTLFVPLDDRTPSPVQSAQQWWSSGSTLTTPTRVYRAT